MEILISLAGKVADYTVGAIGRQFSYVIFYKANFKELSDRVTDLEGKRDETKHRVQNERRDLKKIEGRVLKWLDDADEAIGKANQLQNDPGHAKVGCSRWPFPNVVARHQLSRKATKVAKNVADVHGEWNFPEVAYVLEPDIASTSIPSSSKNFESRKSIQDNVMHALRDRKVSMVGVYGFGGVGKTTLVDEVARIAEKENMFDSVVTIYKTLDIKTVQEKIAAKLGLRSFEAQTIGVRLNLLRERIKREKTILLILDNIYEAFELKKVGIPSEEEHSGCKILMTSRNLDLLRQMGVKKEHFRLDVLNEEESWSLFKSEADNLDREPDKHGVAFRLAKRCGGLPILIVTTAKSLRDQNIHVWKDTLNQLEKFGDEQLQEITYSALELSYKRLRGYEMKALFLLCATIGEYITIDYLFKYGMGLGIFSNTNTMEGARDRLHNMISALKASCLLVEDGTSTTTVKMHDVVREVAISIALRDHHILAKYRDDLKEFPPMDILSECSQIILFQGGFRELPEKLDNHNLKFLYLCKFDLSLEVPNSFFEGTKILEVLDLTGLNLASLPTSFLFLTNLKTLCLDQCILGNIDAVGALKNLEILSLWKSSMMKLSREIGKLTRLKMLDLSHSGIEIIPPGIISSLIKLEELYMGNTSIKWAVENPYDQNENASLDELRQLSNLTALELQIQEARMLPRDLIFDKLERFKIVIGDIWEWADIEDPTLKTLKLKLGTNIHLEHGIKGLIRRAENLYLDEVGGIRNLLYHLNGDGFPQLKHLHVQNNAIIKHIIDFTERTRIPTPFQNLEKLVSFPNLDTLKLSSLNLNKIWKDNRHSFYKLRNLIVENCDGLKYLFSSTMVESFSNLIELEISECHLMEEIIATEDRDNNIVTLKEVGFSKLQTIILKDMKSLKKIWHSEFSKVKTLQVKNCEKIRVIFPSSMEKAYNGLETLMVADCDLVEEIFQLSSDENSGLEQTQLKKITLERLPKLKQTWNKDPERALNFGNLEEINVMSCINLESVIPCSIATSCSHLKELRIKWCGSLMEIVALKEEPTCSTIFFEFSHLSTLVLWNLDKLKGFYAGNHTLTCPSLRILDISGCVKLNLYRTLSTSCHQQLPDEEYIISTQQHLVAEEVIPNLEHLRIDEADADNLFQSQNIRSLFNNISFLSLSRYEKEVSTFPDQVLQNISSLKWLLIELSSFKKIFQDKRLPNEKNCTKIQKLSLNQLPNLQHICEEGLEIDPVLQLLEYLFLDECSSLINLVPSSVTFSYLTFLEVVNCNSMINLLSPPTARSLTKLTEMKVKQCDSLEEIISKEGEEITNDISFFCLETLVLDCLPRLGRFCSQKCFLKFPLLEDVVVTACDRMKYFSEGNTISTPKLRKVLIAENNKEFYWRKNLNDTIKNMFDDKVRSLKNLNLSEHPELKELWYGQLQNNIFNNLKKVVVHKCDFLSDVLFYPNLIDMLVNLEELDVRDCHSLVAVFHIVNSTFSEETKPRKYSLLKKLTLGSLPNLMHIWKEDPSTTLSFQNLCDVSVVDCPSLKSLFPLSVATNMVQLEDLEVLRCGIEEIVDSKREPREMIKFVLPNLNALTVNNNDIDVILQSMYSEDQYNKLERLRVTTFENEGATFPYWFFEKAESLESLIVEWSSFIEIFHDQRVASEDGQVTISTQLRNLTLYQLHDLHHICKEGFHIDPILQHLEKIDVDQCSSLINLVPSSVTFTYLTHLEVANCNRMTNLMTCSTAKSLVNLTTMTVESCNLLEDIVNAK
ncbi:hypothetical protein Ahy_B01g052172 isoform A [Arachis hypogaea]|uniref:Uncharacterized protein n=1 Tax=Arachis hypogaea TaxID=3818 RepID=A0A445ANQ9_ARAHY|nr:hypothetical protein Ahy_B01g052172 isoform A [Arachis hypogaea]